MKAASAIPPLEEDCLTGVSQPSTEPVHNQAPVAKQGLLALLDQGIASATTFLTLLILARTVTKDELGIYSLCLSLVLFATMLQERALAMPYMVFSPKQPKTKSSHLLGSVLVHQAILTVLAVIAVLAYGTYLAVTEGFSEMTVGIVSLSIAMVPFMLRDFFRSLCFAHFQLVHSLWIDATVFTLQIGGLLLLRSRDLLAVPTCFFLVGLACAAGCTTWLNRTNQSMTFDWKEAQDTWQEHWAFSKWLVIGRLLGNGCQVAIPWIVAAMIDRSAAGVLAVCATLAGLSWVFVRGLNNLLQPRAIRAFHTQGKRGLLKEVLGSCLFYGLILGAMCLAFVLVGSWLLSTVFGAEFAEGSTVLILLGLNSLITSLALSCSNALNAMERSEVNFIGELATCLGTLLTAYPLIHFYGIEGAAGAMLAGAVGCLVTMAAVLARELQCVDTD